MSTAGFHHVAYRCRDARETVDWYRKHLGMEFVLAIAEDRVPSTHAADPYMHLFMDAGGGNILAFFELPNSPPMGRDSNTPEWVQHIALKVGNEAELLAAKARLEAAGVPVLGVTDHTIFKSIYFFDPNGVRLEFTAETASAEEMKEYARDARAALDTWTREKAAAGAKG